MHASLHAAAATCCVGLIAVLAGCGSAQTGAAAAKAPARQLVTIDDVGIATAALAGDGARLITGETIYVDGGLHIVG